ncbi:MAG: hypothetical protein A2X96_01620 [Syntrophobacterales bacterium GWC2_56_13]|nr:MAG: hypothetical protein A2X96_01620 [Syntrophobacterales bacterium GWC2_56_13]
MFLLFNFFLWEGSKSMRQAQGKYGTIPAMVNKSRPRDRASRQGGYLFAEVVLPVRAAGSKRSSFATAIRIDIRQAI